MTGETTFLPGRPVRHAARTRWYVPFPLAVGILLFVALIGVAPAALLSDPDSHWHIAVGNWIFEHRRVPTVDSFSHTFAGRPWIAKEWMSQVLLAFAFWTGGWPMVVLLSAASIAAAFALMMRCLMAHLRPLAAGLFTAAAIAMSAPHFLARPHVLALPLMVIWVAGLIRAVEERRAPRPALLVAMLLWANLHAGFTLGLFLCGAFALEAMVTAQNAQERRHLAVGWGRFGVAAILTACITPYGPHSMLVTLQIFTLGDVLNMIGEWKSPDFQSQPLQEFLVLSAVFAALSSGLKVPVVRLLVVVGLLHLFLKHARNAEQLAMLAPLAVAPIMARRWPSLAARPGSPRQRSGRHGPLSWLALAAAYAVGIVELGAIRPPADTTPVAAAVFARQARLTGPVFNHYGFGGYLIHQGIPTFIDGRAELFGGDFIKAYVDAVNLRSEETLEDFLTRHGVEWTFLLREQPANKRLERLPGWREAYSDRVATIFVRQSRDQPQ